MTSATEATIITCKHCGHSESVRLLSKPYRKEELGRALREVLEGQ